MEAGKLSNIVVSRWMEGNGPEDDVVVSSRIRLARNLKDVPFPHKMKKKDATSLLAMVREALFDQVQVYDDQELQYINLGEIKTDEREILVEKHLISPQMLIDVSSKAVVLDNEESVSLMVNEEDHLRIQCILPGLMLSEAWNMASALDDRLESKMDIAYSERYGYLTACPTNIGTGLRASVMMHLPALMLTKQINKVIGAISQIGLTVRGLYGEGTEVHGSLYQVSNQITLGPTEDEIVSKITAVAEQIVNQERSQREALYSQNKWQVEDKIFRALGILKSARLIEANEAMALLSDIRLGTELGILKEVPLKAINLLTVLMRSAYLQILAQRELGNGEKARLRAELLRNYLQVYSL